MLIRKPDDEDPSNALPRSGHGAASVIPHLHAEALHPLACGDVEDASVEDSGQTAPAQTPAAGTDSKPSSS
jgi:hypothetical protein